jgi:hypothetical protein
MVGEPKASTMILLSKQGLVLAELEYPLLPTLKTEKILEGSPERELGNFRKRTEEMRKMKGYLLLRGGRLLGQGQAHERDPTKGRRRRLSCCQIRSLSLVSRPRGPEE